MKITITAKWDSKAIAVAAVLNDTATAKAIADALPLQAVARTWGQEIYFSIPVSVAQELPEDALRVGDLAYWPPGNAFCIFFGPTPASKGDEPTPASPVTVVGNIPDGATAFAAVPDGAQITVKREG